MFKIRKSDSETKEKIETIIRHTARPVWLIGMTTRDEELLRERLAKPEQKPADRYNKV